MNPFDFSPHDRQWSCYLGDFLLERSVFLGLVPSDSQNGCQLRALHLVSGQSYSGDAQDYWLLKIGKYATASGASTFQQTAKEVPLTSFAAGTLKTIAFSDPVLYTKGDLPALLLSPRGDPAPLAGLSCVPEWGILSSNKSSR